MLTVAITSIYPTVHYPFSTTNNKIFCKFLNECFRISRKSWWKEVYVHCGKFNMLKYSIIVCDRPWKLLNQISLIYDFICVCNINHTWFKNRYQYQSSMPLEITTGYPLHSNICHRVKHSGNIDYVVMVNIIDS